MRSFLPIQIVHITANQISIPKRFAFFPVNKPLNWTNHPTIEGGITECTPSQESTFLHRDAEKEQFINKWMESSTKPPQNSKEMEILLPKLLFDIN
jgi:hypothetical protein